MKRLVLAALIGLVFLGGCAEPNHLTSGTVLDKHYDDEDVWYTQRCIYSDSHGICYGYTQDKHVDPPRWSVQVSGGYQDGDKTKQVKEWHTVSERDYDCIRIGAYWRQDADPCRTG